MFSLKRFFIKIQNHIEFKQYLDFSEKFKKNPSQVVLYGKGMPKLHLFLNHDPWDVVDIDLEIVSKITFQNQIPEQLKDFLGFIKTMIYHIISQDKFMKYYTILITSSLGEKVRK